MNKFGLTAHPQQINGNLRCLRENLDDIAEAGADCCELVLHSLDVVIGGKIIAERSQTVRRLLRSYHLEYTLHLPYDLNLLHTEAFSLYVGLFRAGIAFAKEAGIGLIVCHAGRSALRDEEGLEKEIRHMRDLAKEADGISLCMENPLFLDDEEFSAGKNARDMIRFCERVNMPNFKLTLDIGHSFIRHRGNADALLADTRELLPYIGHVHVHDNCGVALKISENDYSQRIACGAGDLHLPPGWGTIPLKEVFHELQDYPGIFNLEIEGRFRNQYNTSLMRTRKLVESNKNKG